MEARKDRFDFIGFGALNVDTFYSLLPGKSIGDIAENLKPGGERIGSESERGQIREAISAYATFISRSGGGQAGNTAVALSRMGFRCGFLGKVGDDELGDFLLKSLEDVDKTHIRRGGNSGVCLCILDSDGERSNIVFPGCNDSISLDDSDVDYVKSGKMLYLTSFCSENMLKLQEWLLEQVSPDTMVAFDPGEIYSRLGINRLGKILRVTHILFATTEELKLMTRKPVRSAVDDIIQCGTDIVVHKMSSRGSSIYSKSADIFIPATPLRSLDETLEVVDKTGAGDVYAAGFLAGILLDLPLDICGKLASNAAALSISAYGRERYPDRQFLEHFLENKDISRAPIVSNLCPKKGG